MDEKLCELAKTICNNTKTCKEVNNQIISADIEIDPLLKQTCKVYNNICNEIQNANMWRRLGMSGNDYVRGLEYAKKHIREWLIEEACKE